MSKAHSTATKARKTTVKPSDVVDLSKKEIRSSAFLLYRAIWEDSYKQMERLLDGPIGQQDFARIARETLGTDCEGIESLHLRQWQIDELDAPTWAVIRDVDGLKYVWIEPLGEWIDRFADRPLSWKDYFAMFSHVSGRTEQEALIYPWQIEAIITEEEWRAATDAGSPRDLNKFLEIVRKVATGETASPEPQGD